MGVFCVFALAILWIYSSVKENRHKRKYEQEVRDRQKQNRDNW
jgi:hypothetical protein